MSDTPMTDKTMRGKIAAAVLLGINNTWELGDQALVSEITRAILALKVAGVPLSELIEKAEREGSETSLEQSKQAMKERWSR